MSTESHMEPMRRLTAIIRNELAKSRHMESATDRDDVVRVAVEGLSNLECLLRAAIEIHSKEHATYEAREAAVNAALGDLGKVG